MTQRIQVQGGKIIYSAPPTHAGAVQAVNVEVQGDMMVGLSGDTSIVSESIFSLDIIGGADLNLSSGFGSVNILSPLGVNGSPGITNAVLTSRGPALSPVWAIPNAGPMPIYTFKLLSIPAYTTYSDNTFNNWSSTIATPIMLPPIQDIYWDSVHLRYVFNTSGRYAVTVTMKAIPINAITALPLGPTLQPEPWPHQSTVLRTILGGTATTFVTDNSTHSTYKLDADPTSTHEDRTWTDTFVIEANVGNVVNVQSYAYNIDYPNNLVNFSGLVIFTKIG